VVVSTTTALEMPISNLIQVQIFQVDDVVVVRALVLVLVLVLVLFVVLCVNSTIRP
jgi:ABC-type spermidine/putrescine transport system permease subunit I